MKSIPAALLAHVQGQCTTLATLWLISRTDGRVFAFTDLDADITYQGRTYMAATGVTPSSVATNSDLSVDNMEMVGVLNSETITDADLLSGLWDYAKIRIIAVNYKDLSQGHMFIKSGRIGEVKSGLLQFTAEIRGLTQNLQQDATRVYQTSCDAKLGDARCKVAMASRTYSGAVLAAPSSRIFTTTLTNLAPGLCNNGLVTFTSGANAGRSREVKFFGGAGAELGDDREGKPVRKFAGGRNWVGFTLPLPVGATLTAVYRVHDDTGLEYTLSSGSPSAGRYFQVGNELEFHLDDLDKLIRVKFGYSTFVGGVSGQVELQEAMFGVISPGDAFTITQGCDHTIETCKARFDNVVHFRGFPFIKSQDAILRGPV